MKSLGVQEVFKKVHLSEKKILFREAASEKRPLLVKDDNDEIVNLIAFRAEDDEKLFCTAAGGAAIFTVGQEVVANFTLHEESYFFKTTISFDRGIPVLNTDTDLFQLQRRANARLDLPDDFPATANIIEFNGASCFFSNARVKDVSAGGCKIFLERYEPIIRVGDKIKIALHLSHRRPFHFMTDVRFVAKVENGQVFGVQFLGRDNITENRLLVLMMDLQRELYMKFGPTA